jgi:hypothetical protein
MNMYFQKVFYRYLWLPSTEAQLRTLHILFSFRDLKFNDSHKNIIIIITITILDIVI